MKFKEIVIVVGVIILDLVSKFIVASNIELHKPIEVIKNFFYITYAKNTGAAWSMFEGNTLVLSMISLVVSIAMLVWLLKNKKESFFTRFCVLLMLAGAIGNLIDRVTLGYVVDFLDFYIFGYDFPIFNIADSSLSIGVGLLLIASFFEKGKVHE